MMAKQTRPRSIPNVSDDRLLADLVALSARIDTDDAPRGQLVRFAAKRTLVVFELRDRGVAFDFDGPVGSRSACRALFGLPV